MPAGSRTYHRAANELGIEVLGIDTDDVHALELLDGFTHPDPFDRISVACAKQRMLPLLTRDEYIRKYLESAIW